MMSLSTSLTASPLVVVRSTQFPDGLVAALEDLGRPIAGSLPKNDQRAIP